MTIDQAKELMRISRLKSARVRVEYRQEGMTVSELTGRFSPDEKVETGKLETMYFVFNTASDMAVIHLTDKVEIEKEDRMYCITVHLTGRRKSFAKLAKIAMEWKKHNKQPEETNHEQC